MRSLSIAFALALAVFAAGCSKSSDTSSSTSATATPVPVVIVSAAATGAAAMSAATSAAASSGDAAGSGTTDDKTGLPIYPGATSSASGANGSGQAGTVLTTDDSFDKVYAWYKDHMPAGSEKAKLSAGGMSSATFQTAGDSGKQVVAITSQGGKTTISLAKTQ